MSSFTGIDFDLQVRNVVDTLLTSIPRSRDELRDLFTLNNAITLLLAWLTWQLVKAVYNVSPLHPLNKIPGPKLAAATYLPEFWYDAVKFGHYTNKIKEMHERYGPIVRINPNEVHCNDPSFADEIYAVSGRKRDKNPHQVSGSSMMGSTFATSDHDHHRIRRAPLAKFFSRSRIAHLEPEIHKVVQRACHKLLSQAGTGEPIDVTMAYSCFTSDAIAEYCFGESFGFLDQEGWEPNFRAPLYSMLKTVYIFRFFPILQPLTMIAEWMVDYLPADMALLIRTLSVDIPARIKKVKQNTDAGIELQGRPTVLGSMLESDLPQSEKGVARVSAEAASVLGAGTETTSWTLSVITYNLLKKPELLANLTRELTSTGVVTDPTHLPPWQTLEKLPYLRAVIHEGLRLSYGVSARTSRVPTGESLIYKGEWTPLGAKKPVSVTHVIPRGSAIGMSAAISHHDERYYPDSFEFNPNRWVDADNNPIKEPEKALLSFSKGSRSCIGMNLAWCELYLSIAAFTLQVWPRMSLYETSDIDVRYHHDMFVPLMDNSSKGVRVTIN